MRTAPHCAAVFAAVACAVAVAQSPPPIVIRPKAPGGATPANPKGMIVITPNGKGAVAPAAPPAPATPTLPAAPAAPAAPEPPEGRPLFDYWFAATVDGKPLGYMQWSAREVERDGRKLLVGVKYQKFIVSRFGQVVPQWGEESTVEDTDGNVLVTSMRQGLGRDQALALTGTVKDGVLKMKGEGAAAAAQDTPWPAGVVGIAREPFLIRDRKAKVGEPVEYKSYVPQLNRVVAVTTTAEAEVTAALWEGTPPKKLVKVVSKMAPIGQFRLPASVLWCDAATLEPQKVEFDFPGLGGRVSFTRTTPEAARRPITRPIELFNVQSVRLDRVLPNVHGLGSVVYKVTMPQDEDPGSAFPTDGRQKVANLDPAAKSFELTAGRDRAPAATDKPAEAPGPEFLGSSYFIASDDAQVKAHAAAAVANLPPAATALDKARAIEKWVRGNMRSVEFSQAMATADNVAKTLSGDCTEYAMLSAAMCRAAGVPSRTALGLVYAPSADGKPYLAYHMWFEAFADGRWVGLDGTLGLGGVGPGHVKISDHSWHEERSFAPLLPVLRVLMAKPAFEVLKVNP